MSNQQTHIAEDLLLRYADRELLPAEMAATDRHLLECGVCRDRLHAMQSTLEAYERHLEVSKLRLPAPPREWPDLKFEQPPKVLTMPARNRSRAAMWIAAAACLVVMLGIALFRPGQVSAAELLDKAIVRERQSAPSQRKIRVKIRNLLYTRPAKNTQESPELQGVRTRFAAARYSWDDPLSASAFAAWRDQLPEKTDTVTTLSQADRNYTVTTRTGSGELAQVALTLRASDFRAIHEVFHFRDDYTVELSEAASLPDLVPSPSLPVTSNRPSQSPSAGSPATVTLGDEIRVLAALHAIGADLGEPVEVLRDAAGNRLLVTATGLDAARQEQLRQALGAMPNLTLRFDASEPAPEARRTNDVLEQSETLLGRAHALRNLADRVSPAAESGLAREDRRQLLAMVRTHAGELQRISSSLANAIGDSPSAGASACDSWQACANETLRAARKLDAALTRNYAAPERATDETKAAALNALVDLLGRIAAWNQVLP